MKSLIFLVLLFQLAYSKVLVQPNLHPLSDEMINQINSLETTWKAGRNFDKDSLNYVKGLLGVRKGSKKNHRQIHHEINDELPESFDSREVWSNCTQLRVIRDQGNCGSCWAFSSVEAMSDRICIASKGKIQVSLSAQEMVACSDLGGCSGGWPFNAYEYYADEGLVTGGLYQGDGCLPYTFEPCMHHISGPVPTCPESYKPTPECSRECVDGYDKTFEEDKHYGQEPYYVSADQYQIMKEIMTNGPVTVDFTVYADFPNYKSGVYQMMSGDALGGHAVKMIGWGNENGVDYWLIANSWNEYWGDNGFCKIRRGTNECGIEEDVVGGLPKL